MDNNFPTVPHFLTPSTSSTTTSTSTSTSTSTTHDDSRNSHLISSIYEPFTSPTSTQFCYQTPRYLAQDHYNQALQFPAGSVHLPGLAYRPLVVAAGQSVGAVLVGVSEEQERRLLDAWTTKVARSKRRLARQRSLNLVTRQCSPPSSSSSSSSSSSTTHAVASFSGATTLSEYTREQPISGAGNRDLYTFCTPDNKRLRILLKKELKNSDVGSLGRIVLPKREAEEKLPILSDKEGIQLVMRDIYSNRDWSLRYKYWSNNKSRMYVLENTGDFVKQNGLEIGDSIALYEDECKNLYISIKKGTKAVTESSHKRHLSNPKITADDNNVSNSNSNSNSNSTTTTSSDDIYDHANAIANSQTPADYNNSLLSSASHAFEVVARDEEDASLALLIEQLNHKEQQEANSLDYTTLSHIEYGNDSLYGQSNEISSSSISSINYNNVVMSCSEGMPSTDHQMKIEAVQLPRPPLPPPPPPPSSSWSRSFDDYFDDCYGGLGTLPEIDSHEYYGYATLFDRLMSEN